MSYVPFNERMQGEVSTLKAKLSFLQRELNEKEDQVAKVEADLAEIEAFLDLTKPSETSGDDPQDGSPDDSPGDPQGDSLVVLKAVRKKTRSQAYRRRPYVTHGGLPYLLLEKLWKTQGGLEKFVGQTEYWGIRVGRSVDGNTLNARMHDLVFKGFVQYDEQTERFRLTQAGREQYLRLKRKQG